MKKILWILGVGIILTSCSYESIYNTTTTTTTTTINETDNSHDNHYGTQLDSIDTLYVVDPWIEQDTTEIVGG